MNKLINSINRDYQVYVFAIFTSILLSILIGYRNSVINPDGICYILGAEMLGSASLREVMQLCPQSQWPFYSALIYALQQISHLSYGVSAHFLNALLSLISVITFIRIVELLGGNQRITWLAALIILFDHQFNILRDNIIRDHGFWAFYIISIYLLLKYFREPKWITALLWNISLLIATLFRIEAAIFLLGMPFIAWLYPGQPLLVRTRAFLMLSVPLIALGIAAGFWHLFHPAESLLQWGRVWEILHQLKNGLFILIERFQSVKTAMIQHILPGEARPDAGIIVLLIWIGWYLYNVVLTLSWGYAILLLYAFTSRSLRFRNKSAPVIAGYIIINILLTMGFLAESLFISKRYLIGLTLVLMFWLPFAVNNLIEKWGSLRHRLFLIFMILVFFISALSGVVEFGRSKYFIRTAGDWISSEIPPNSKLYVNDFQLMYYTDHFGLKIFDILPSYLESKNITDGKWKQYDYLALRLRKNELPQTQAVLKELKGIVPMKIFSDKHGNNVTVYKLVVENGSIRRGETK